jgi:Fe2+ or Zn2+ uptake regulation protein
MGIMPITCDYAEEMPPDLHEDVAARLADHDGRYTGSRRDLIQALAEAGRPLTVDEIVERSTRQRPSSVYRNLAVFEAEGVVRRLAGTDDVARFELTEALGGHHHHLACQHCGAMTDVQLPHDLERQLDEALTQLARSKGFAVRSHEVDAVGVCKTCSDSPNWARPAMTPPRDR